MSIKTKETLTALVTEDLVRSGLTLEDVHGEILSETAMRKRLGRVSRIPAKGGYTIPYFGLDGNPIMDCGLPYERFRLVGIEDGADIGKYLSPVGSSAHLYIPQPLREALKTSAVGPVLVVTEGEKKAVATCKAGIPCVALPGITMYKDSKDKDALHPEIRFLLQTLFDNADIHTVDVIFDSDGYPLKKEHLPSDEVEASKYKEIKSGANVRNRDVFNHAFKLAGLIKQTIAHLQVGYGWCAPAFSVTQGGPKGGKVKHVGKQGLDDALVAGNLKDVKDWIASIAGRAKPGDGKGGCVPLGTDVKLKVAYLWAVHPQKIVETPITALNNPATLASYCGESWLESRFTKYTKTGAEVDYRAAAARIASDCSAAGTFHPQGRLFGTGVWAHGPDKDNLVINTHHGVYTMHGEAVERFASGRKEIYTESGVMSPPAYRPVTDDEYHRVCKKINDDLDTWAWSDALINPVYIVGWLTMSVFLGALEHRPNLWIIGQAASGKTQLTTYMTSVLQGYIKTSANGAMNSEAGLRQTQGHACYPHLLDEMEKENTQLDDKTAKAIASLTRYSRVSFSGDGTISKGTADQTGMDFRTSTTLGFVSIAEPALEPADRTRFCIVRILRQDSGAAKRQVTEPPKPLTADESAVFIWGTIQRYGRFLHTYATVRRFWSELAGAGDSREKITFGTVLAAAMVTMPEIQTDEHIAKALKNMLAHVSPQLDDVRESTAEHEIILHTLMTQNVVVEYHETDDRGNDRVNRETRSVGGLIYNMAVRGNQDADEIRALALIGLAVKNKDGVQGLAIASKHTGLATLLRSTRYNRDGSWAGGLKDVPGAIVRHTARIDGCTVRAIFVPLEVLGIVSHKEEPCEVKPLYPHAVPPVQPTAEAMNTPQQPVQAAQDFQTTTPAPKPAQPTRPATKPQTTRKWEPLFNMLPDV